MTTKHQDAPTPTHSFTPYLRRSVLHPIGDEPSMTKQEFKDDSDINSILAKFQRTGAMSHFAKYAPNYGDFSACDYQTAQNLLIRAQKMFDDLPSSVRSLVSTPAGFLDFVQDPANASKMQELGLLPSAPPITPAPPSRPPSGGSGGA